MRVNAHTDPRRRGRRFNVGRGLVLNNPRAAAAAADSDAASTSTDTVM